MPDAASCAERRTRTVSIRQAVAQADFDAVRELCWEYRAYLENFGPEQRRITQVFYPETEYADLMSRLEEKHARPRGIVLLAEIDGQTVGCGMSHALSAEAAEIKRVFLREQARGSGAGRALSQALVDQARADGYKVVYLDTSQDFVAARGLYESIGFEARGPYAPVPRNMEQHLCFYELTL
ncbi:GNAT family N-acetyltransferase [Sulfitobacter sp. LCG007]